MIQKNTHAFDPQGLIGEAFRIDGIPAADCRAIFFDWALGLDPAVDPREAARALLLHHDGVDPAHPMIALLHDATAPKPAGRRRGRTRG